MAQGTLHGAEVAYRAASQGLVQHGLLRGGGVELHGGLVVVDVQDGDSRVLAQPAEVVLGNDLVVALEAAERAAVMLGEYGPADSADAVPKPTPDVSR